MAASKIKLSKTAKLRERQDVGNRGKTAGISLTARHNGIAQNVEMACNSVDIGGQGYRCASIWKRRCNIHESVSAFRYEANVSVRHPKTMTYFVKKKPE
jgi:hypothetical protein